MDFDRKDQAVTNDRSAIDLDLSASFDRDRSPQESPLDRQMKSS